MRLHTDPKAPSPRRVHLFLHVRDIDLPLVDVALAEGEQFTPDFLALNPDATVPVLELDDGSCLTEIVAICRYLDDIHDGERLYGNTALERAQILEADHWLEMQGLLAVMEGFRNATPGMKDRALPGLDSVRQLPELAERGRLRFERFLDALDRRLDRDDWIAGARLSGADITAWVILEFAGWALKITPNERHSALLAWHGRARRRVLPDADG